MDRLAHLSFSVTDDEELERQHELFQQVCSQKVQCLDNEDDDEDLWGDHNMMSSRYSNEIIVILLAALVSTIECL